MYWSTVQGLRIDLIANSMLVNRLEEIKRFLHFVNNDDAKQLKMINFGRFHQLLRLCIRLLKGL